jgi:hypothetical protein
MPEQPQEDFDREYMRWAWIVIPVAVCVGWVIADGPTAALPVILVVGGLLAALRISASGRLVAGAVVLLGQSDHARDQEHDKRADRGDQERPTQPVRVEKKKSIAPSVRRPG